MSIVGRSCDMCGKQKPKEQFEPLMLQEITDNKDGSKLRKVITIRMGAYETKDRKIPNFDVSGKVLEPNTVTETTKTPDNFDYCQECTREVVKEALK